MADAAGGIPPVLDAVSGVEFAIDAGACRVGVGEGDVLAYPAGLDVSFPADLLTWAPAGPLKNKRARALHGYVHFCGAAPAGQVAAVRRDRAI